MLTEECMKVHHDDDQCNRSLTRCITFVTTWWVLSACHNTIHLYYNGTLFTKSTMIAPISNSKNHTIPGQTKTKLTPCLQDQSIINIHIILFSPTVCALFDAGTVSTLPLEREEDGIWKKFRYENTTRSTIGQTTKLAVLS